MDGYGGFAGCPWFGLVCLCLLVDYGGLWFILIYVWICLVSVVFCLFDVCLVVLAYFTVFVNSVVLCRFFVCVVYIVALWFCLDFVAFVLGVCWVYGLWW